MSKPRKTQQTQQDKEIQQNTNTQENVEKQHTQKEQENTNTQETQQDISASDIIKSARTVQTPMGAAIVAEGSDLTPEEIQAYFDKPVPEELEALNERIDAFIDDCLKSFAEQPDMEKITAVFPDAKDWVENSEKPTAFFVFVCLSAVLTYIDILPDYLKENDIDPSIIKFATTLNPETNQTPLEDFLAWNEHRGESEAAPEALEIMGRRAKMFGFPRDRVSDKIFSAPETRPGKTELKLEISTNPKDKKNDPHFTYKIDFSTVESEVPFVKRLTPFDKRVCIAYGALMEAGNSYFTYDQLFRAMGYSRTPRQSEKDAIDASLTKMSARAHIDNEAEIAAGYHYEEYHYDGPFLAFERLTGAKATVNGKKTDTLIHTLRYPFVLQIAAKRKELQKVPMAVLQSNLNRSDSTLQIEDYIIGRISDVKRGYSKENKILFTKLYARVKVKADDRKAKKRIREYSERFLEHCKNVNWIKDFKTEKDSVTFYI